MTQQEGQNPYEKDCGCPNHEGPCWLKSDYDTLQEHLTLLERAIEHAQADSNSHDIPYHGFLQRERGRLHERNWHARKGGEFPYSLLGVQYEDLEARRVQLLQAYEQAVKDMAERKRQRDIVYRQIPEAPSGQERKRVLKSCLKFQVEYLAHTRLITSEKTEKELAACTQAQRDAYVLRQKNMRYRALTLSLLLDEAKRLKVALPPNAQQVFDLAAILNDEERAECLQLASDHVIPESIRGARVQRDDFVKGYGSPDIPLETKLKNIDNSIALFALLYALATQTRNDETQPAQQHLFPEGEAIHA